VGELNNSTASSEVFMVFRVKPEADEQIEKGEQLLQSFLCFEGEDCSVCSSFSQLSNTVHGTTALNKM
jgi:hypothetical protein